MTPFKRSILNGTTDDVLNNNKIADAIQNIHLTKNDLHGDQNYKKHNKMQLMN